ncbi:MAG TPA: sugar phosphate isomerase/epimerase family protein, partial [Bryobacteraceae bacterium]
MSSLSRRSLLLSLPVAGLRTMRAAGQKLRIGVTDWNLRLGAKPEAVTLASSLGFDGVQLSFGRRLVADKLPFDNPETVDRALALSAEHKIPIDGTCVDRLHDNGLKSDKLAPKWVSDSIRLTKALHTKVLLVPFFGKWALTNREEMDYTADALRELGPEAEKAGVILGLEDTISAEDNVRIMDRARSKNVLVYYDVGNSTKAGFDVVKEIRWLGRDRICQFHLKDN